jgi:hypothetical protein
MQRAARHRHAPSGAEALIALEYVSVTNQKISIRLPILSTSRDKGFLQHRFKFLYACPQMLYVSGAGLFQHQERIALDATLGSVIELQSLKWLRDFRTHHGLKVGILRASLRPAVLPIW